MIEFFDDRGRAAAFCADGQSLYLWDGRAAAFLDDAEVYAYSGAFVGWLDDGWIIDRDGGHLLFESDAVGGPDKPKRQPKSVPGVRHQRPPRGVRLAPPPRPVRTRDWSRHAFLDLI